MPFFRQLATRLNGTVGSKTRTFIGMPAAVSENPADPNYFGKYSITIRKQAGDPGSTTNYEWTAVATAVMHTGNHRKLKLLVTCTAGDPAPIPFVGPFFHWLKLIFGLLTTVGDVIDVDVTVTNPEAPVPPATVGIVVVDP